MPTALYAQFTLSGSSYLSQPAGVVTEVIKKIGVLTPQDINGLQASEHVTLYNYLDGFGRPLQNIVTSGSPNGKDLISFSIYDGFGRQTTQYLPFEAATTNGTYQDHDQTGVAGVQTNQAGFYNTTGIKIANDTKPWVTVDVEQSPMQRLLKQGSVGDGYQVTQSHYKTVLYHTNDATDNNYNGGVRKWSSDGTSGSTYSANDLTVTEATDENSVKTMVFTDKMGRVVLKRQQADENIGGTTYNYFDTYYIYDLLGNISYVVPPKAVVKLTTAGWNVSNTPELIFSYTYDTKNRVVQKKVPTAQTVYVVYDALDRAVLVQDGNMRPNNNWYYRKYDNENRTIIEGIYSDATHTGQSGMQSYVDGIDYNTNYYEQRTTGTSSWYTNNCFPTSSVEERIYYYYDDYDFDNNGSADYSYTSQGLTGEGTATDKTMSLLTGIKKKIIGTSNWITSATFYDKFYNPIQTKSNNQLKPTTYTDLVTNVTDFAGRLTISKEYHSITSGEGGAITTQKTFSYDKMDRLQDVRQTINAGSETIMGKYEYNSLGQAVDRKLHSINGGASFLQSVDLRYSIRGQLTSINNSTLTSDNGVTNDETNDVWGMNLLYDQSDASIGNTANYTGLLSAVKWKANVSGGNSDQRTYLFSYDKLNRLSSAAYKAYNGSNWTKDANGFNETATYDWNGNILTMQRNAVISGSVTQIDNVSYDYGTNNDNNKLLNVTESSSNSYGFKNITGSSSGYVYDNNGNLATDNKKGVTLTYNELNKVVRITQTSTGKYVEYGYDAAGIRISQKVSNSNGTAISTDIEYIAGFVYTNNVLSYFSTPEGRVRYNSSTFTYEYFIADQQGNVRVSFEDNGNGVAQVRQENSYYPYGMMMPGNYMPTDPNKKLYNAGSEWQDEINIEYFSTFYREYDPALGRFNSVDPMAEATVELSIYHYSNDNPVNFNDPMGNYAAPAVSIVDVGSYDYVRMMTRYGELPHNDYTSTEALENMWNSGGGGGFWSADDPANIYYFKQVDWKAIELNVNELTKAQDYKGAYSLIVAGLAEIFGDKSNYYYLRTYANPEGQYTAFRSKEELKGQTGDNAKPAVVTLSEVWLDQILLGINSVRNFGDVVRSVYHEIYVHVSDFVGPKNNRPTNKAEYEFRGYYNEYVATGMPAGKLKFSYWLRTLISDDPREGAVSQIPTKRLTLYQDQIRNIIFYVWSQIFKY
jgi:RHS repeat-associated protein